MQFRSSAKPYLILMGAVVFAGIQTPLAKFLLQDTEPILISALLYLGAGIGTTLFRMVRRLNGVQSREARLNQRDVPWLVASILVGGVIAPLLLMTGLQSTPAATASLLLNFEGASTALWGAWVFGEAVGGRTWWAVGLITVGSTILSLRVGAAWGISLGALAILGTGFLWGVDNHLTRALSAKDPLVVVSVRGISAGSLSLLLAVLLGKPLPSWSTILGTLALGFVSYGLALVLFIWAMRDLGATRAAAFFGLTPFVGSALAFVLFRDTVSPMFFASIPFMIAGAWLLATERHSHWHVHEPLAHEHRHRHDDGHHFHAHPPGEEPAFHQAHSHWHVHSALAHEHPHTPDLHHRHAHRNKSAPADQDRFSSEERDRQSQEK